MTRHPAIVDRLVGLMGEDILAWGMCFLERHPNERFLWHTDIEHVAWPGISVCLGLEGMTPRSSLIVAEGSHLVPYNPQDNGISNYRAIMDHVRSYSANARLVQVPLHPGQFFLFHGKLWHASHNTSNGTRTSAIIQYSPSSARIAIPLSLRRRVDHR